MKETPSEYVYGIHAVIELLQSGRDAEAVLVNKEAKGPRLTELRKLLKDKAVPTKNLPAKAFTRFGNRNHQGVVAIVSPVQYVDLEWLVPKLFEEGKMPLFLILDQVTDVRNFGAICRSASCFGVDGIVISEKGSAIINEFAIQASAGAIFHLSICRVRSLLSSLTFLRNSGFGIVSCTERGGENYFEGRYIEPTALVLGSEEKGISPALLDISDRTVRIPMRGPVESLNVSVACGIFLSEVFRQRIDN